MGRNFVLLDEMLPGIRWGARYTTWDSFTGKPVDGYTINRIVGTKEPGTALRKAQKAAEKLRYGLLLQNGYRPQCAVDYFLNWASLPEDDLAKKRYYPNIERKEIVAKECVTSQFNHSRGSTTDFTIFRSDMGMLIPMDGSFDFVDVRSYHAANDPSEEETNNRESLRTIMERSRFEAYRYEWWHYVLMGEPYPDTYFDSCVAQQN